MNIVVKYTCLMCGLIKVECSIEARQEEDIVTWTNSKLIVAIAHDHRKRSPYCHATEITEVMIPITGAEKIGGPINQ